MQSIPSLSGQTLIVLKKYRQIGNAVPVHLALELGKALGETLISHWRDDVTEISEHSEGDSVHFHRNRESSIEL